MSRRARLIALELGTGAMSRRGPLHPRRGAPSACCAAALALATSLGGCLAFEPLTVEAEGPLLVAWLPFDAEGGISRGGVLRAWPEGQALALARPAGAPGYLLVYPAALLAPLGAGAAVSPAPSCAPLLPPPLAAWRWSASGHERLDLAMVPPLAAAAEACPEWSNEALELHLACRPRRCAEVVQRQGACGFTLALAGCGLDPVAGRVHPDGAVCVDPAALPCPPEPALAPALAPWTVRRAALFPGAQPVTPPFLGFNGLLAPELMFFGYAFDLAVLEDRVVVAAGAGHPGEVCGEPGAPTRLLSFTRGALELMGSSTAAPCLSRLQAEAGGQSFVAAHRQGERWALSRFTAAGVPLASQALDPALAPEHRLLDLEADEERIVVLFNRAAEDSKDPPGGNLLVVHDARDLRPLELIQRPAGQRWAMARVTDGGLALLENRRRELELLPRAGAARVLPLPRSVDVQDDSALDLVAAAGQLWAGATRDPMLLVLSEEGELLQRGWSVARELNPVTVAPWPEGQVLVAGLTQGSAGGYQAHGALYHPGRARFLPGAWPLGSGMPTRARAGPEGEIYLLLPWAGEVLALLPAGGHRR